MKQTGKESMRLDLGGRFADLSPAKRALLQQRLKEKGLESPLKQTITRRTAAQSAPLSFSQQRLWFLDQYEPNSSVYNVASALRLEGRLDLEALKQSLNEIVRRHEALRTTFSIVEGEPQQVIVPSLSVSIPIVDLTGSSESDKEDQARAVASNEALRPFDLRQGPLFRSMLVRLSSHHHILILAMHHIVSDGWSTGVLYRELSLLYQAFSHSQPSPLPELPIQYADYAVWQREWLKGTELDRQLSYWKKQLAGAPPLLKLPTDHPRPAVQSYRGARGSIDLSKELTRGLKALSQREGVTLFMTLLAAFQTLLNRYSRLEDVVVGSPIANRNRTEIEGLIGFFVNTLVLRTDLSGDPSFRELLQRTRKIALEAYEHQDLPFEKLVEELKPERNLSHSPLFQVMFVLQNAPGSSLKSEGLTVTREGIGAETAKFDLTLSIREETAGLRVALQYCIDLFEESTIIAMLGHFQILLESIVSDPGQCLSQLPCLNEEEQRQLDRRIKGDVPVETRFDDLELFTNLTPLQFQFWIGQKLNPAMALYNMIALFTISGVIKPECFQNAFQTLIEQASVLRTIIEENREVPHARELADFPYSMEFIDLSSRLDASSALQEWVEQRSAKLFELDKRLFDTALLRLAEDRYVWYLNIHHIIADGWSFAVIFQRMQRLYQCSSEPRFERIEASPTFHDYVEEERAYRRSSEYRHDQAYWETKLAQAAEPLNFYGHAPAAGAVAVRRVTFALGEERIRKIRVIARQPEFIGKTLNVAFFNIFAAVFAAYLYRLSGNRCISIGTPFSNRSKKYSRTVGLFMQVAPLRLNVAADDTFTSLIQKMQAESLQAQKHRRYTHRNLQHRLYDAIFNYHNVSFADFNGAPVEQKWLHSGNDTASLALHLRDPEASSLSLQFDFHPDVFCEEQQERAINHFRQLLDAFLADPKQPIRQVDLLSSEEKQRLLVEFNQSEISASESAGIHQLFERQVQQTPEAVALVSHAPDLEAAHRQQLTYRELNCLANQLAHYLRRQGVAPGVLVGVCLERSLEAVVAILAVLKAGGAYLPLNPDYPAERIAFMLEDAQPLLLLTKKRWAETLPAHKTQMICMDVIAAALAREAPGNPTLQQTSDDPVYVIYTSGSTGRSKGVLIPHRSLLNAYLGWEISYQLHSAHAHLQMANLSFDVFAGDLARALCSGAKLVLCPTEIMLDPASLYRLIRQEEIDWAEFVPPVLRQLIQHLSESNQRLDFMRGVVCGSDTWHVDEYRRCLQFCGPMTRLINSYGVTEASIDSAFFEGAIPARMVSGWVPIGRCFGQAQLYILDESMRPTPMGVPGELCIGGHGLARGYLNRPELTAEKFIPNSFSSEPGSHLYQTGDLCRYLPDGNIEFLGRIDHQVKIRGFRIELGEIESVMAQHPAVREAVVVARGDDSAGKRLVAYVVAEQTSTATILDLRSFLKEKLPEYMVPAAFVVLESLPLTLNGKVDRTALPVPEGRRLELDENFSAPQSLVEEILAGIWAQVLKLDRVGNHDNFFDLGGHSLLATQVVSRVNQAFRVELPLRNLFEAPTIDGLAKRIEHIRRKAQDLQTVPIAPSARTSDLPLSFSQQRLWFLDQLEPNSSAYNVPTAQRLKGPLDIRALEQSLNEIVRRHQVLRTTFSTADGLPVQRIAASLELSLSLIDLSHLPESEVEAEVRRLANRELQQAFDLERGPLLRSILLRLGSEDHVWLLTVHHIAFDGWSLGVLFRELSVLYEAFSNGKPSPLEELPIQYSDFAQWQREWLQGEVLDAQLSYWKKRLENLQTLPLPTDRARPTVQRYRGASQSIVLSGELTEGLKTLSRQQDVTLFMTLLAAFQTMLYRYTGQDDIVVGSPIANRNRAEIEGVIGFFVNTLVFRNDFSNNPTFRELLARVRESSLEAYEHQDLPFEKLVEEIQPERNLSTSPLFQVMFVFQNAPRWSLTLPGVSLVPLKVDSETAKFDMLLSMSEHHQSLRATLQYNTDLFDGATITRLLAHLETLLNSLVEDPACRISDLPLLPTAERHQLLSEWNDTAAALPEADSVHELFEKQVTNTPEMIAVAFGAEQLTYRQLNQRADQLAHRLRKFGVRSGISVGICMNRSVEMMVALLATLKAGGAYVPLDPTYPKDRLSFMLNDARVSVLLTQDRLVKDLPENRARTICLDRDWQDTGAEREENFDSGMPRQDLAYLIYTSGSTGRPKAVAMSHRALCNLIAWQIRNFTQWNPAKTLQFASLSFDVSFQEIFSTWCSGGTLLLISEEVRWDAPRLLRFLKEEAIERLFLPRVALQQLAEATLTEGTIPTHLREVITAGEQLQITREIAHLFDKLKDCTLQNQYGPSESHVVTTYILTGSSVSWPALPAIGRPIANTNIFILDGYLNPVPTGVSGELYIGGVGLASGYFNRPDLTAEKFVPHPFSTDAGARFYRTGDLARYLPGGNIEFLGRIDDQVKIRGFRIELGEIETILAHHPSVKESVVVVRQDIPGDRRLVAYVVANEPSAASTSELRRFLKEKLPEYMIPSVFLFLEALPVTVNGKVDRRALPTPPQNRPELDESFSVPRSESEEILAGMWAEVLKLDSVGTHDNFFDLGGHSLLATQVMSRVRELFQVELPLRCLFERPTVAGLAQHVEEVRREERGWLDVPIVPVPRDRELPLSFAQERLWFLDQLEPGNSVYNVSGAFRLSGRLDVAALERSLNEIVGRHEALRTTFRSVEGSPRQVIAAQLILSLPVIDLSEHLQGAREDQVRRYAAEAARRPFDLSQGPLVRTILLRLGAREHILLLSMHHIVYDGWSMGILFRELSILYDAYANGKAMCLPELPIQYVDYAVWQRDWLKGEVLETQLCYWRKQLENVPALKLATDRPRPALQTFHGARESLLLSKDLTQALKDVSRKQAASLFMTLLTALQIFLHRLTGQDDIAVGSPIAGRNRAEIENLIGFFLNTLVLRTNLSGDPTFLQLLDKVRGVCLEAYAHQDVPFEKLLEELRPERDLSRTPFFQVFLNMINVAERIIPAELQIESLSNPEVQSKFDLTIYVREHNGALQLNWVYNADLFDRERIREMLSQYETLLTQISEQPAKSVHAYSLLTHAARELLPNPAEPLASDWVGSVHDKLFQHARSFPDAVAIVDPNGGWTYAELNAGTNRLANYLLTSGIQREEIIAVYAHRSAALPWALLGILKAGAAFLILDPAYPTARLMQYVRGAQPRGFISLAAAGAVPTDLARVVEETIQCRVALPSLSELPTGNFFENYSSADPEIEIRPDDLAYVSYTSGSTGEPKAVLGRHGPLSHFLPWQTAHFALTSADRFSLLSGLSHDPLHREILTALWVGATLCIPDPDLLGASSELPGWMAEQRITFAHLTPAMIRLLAESAKPQRQLPGLRYAFFVGDKLTWTEIARLRCLAPQVTSVNYYGSTETQRAVSYHEIPPQSGDGSRGVLPVGRGMPGAQLLVLTKARNLAGIGEVGDIYMRSPHLAREYLGDPSLTEARFITNPFTGEAHDRMYQTGDLGRYLHNGSAEVLGRTDGQVNIRGFRVEMGEIEFALGQSPAVRDVVVVAREDAGGDKQLIAYVVAAQGDAPSVHELRGFLKQRMPEHMIPSAFVWLASLPLTPNGKLDRRALPAPDYTRQEQEAAPVAPRDGLELQLRQIWEKVLKVRPIGIKDNFFDLGGHSLLAVRLFAQIERVMGKSLPVAALFHGPTIEQLAGLLSRQEWSAQWKSLVAIQPGGSRPPFFCVHAHDGGVLFWRDLARHLGKDQPFYALQAQGLDGQQPLHSRFEEMAAHYIKEMRTLQPEGPYFIGGHCIGGLVAFEMAQQLHAQREKVALLALFDSFAPRGQSLARSSVLRRYRHRAVRLFERTVSLHISNLAFLEARERLPYVKGKIDKALYKLYMFLGAPWVPAARNRREVLKAGSHAARHYNPKSYPGKITLFRATNLGRGIKHDRQMGWGRLAGAELETHLIPGYHAHIVLEPRVRLLAKELMVSLRKAREKFSKDHATGAVHGEKNSATSAAESSGT